MTGKSRHNQDDLIVESLARGEGQTATATLAGVSVSTVRRRLEDPDFRQRVDRFREGMLDAAAGRLGATVEKAVKTLEGLLADDTPPATRLAAARSVIEFTFRSREILSWEQRLAEVEARARADQSRSEENRSRR